MSHPQTLCLTITLSEQALTHIRTRSSTLLTSFLFNFSIQDLDKMAATTTPSGAVMEPIPISLISGRYLLFDIDTVTYLRRIHNTCGVLMGTIPQIPQQNVFLGLPVELLPEEARLLVQKEVAYIVDDASWHRNKLRGMSSGVTDAGVSDRKSYLASLRAEGRRARVAAEKIQGKRAEKGLAKQAMLKAQKEKKKAEQERTEFIELSSSAAASISTATNESSGVNATSTTNDVPTVIADIFDSPVPNRARTVSNASSMISSTSTSYSGTPSLSDRKQPYTLTPTTTYGALPGISLPTFDASKQDVPVPSSYPLFKHLHAHDYFLTPGLRFGCDYTVYPGDPLRFHSHFLAVGYGWEDKIPLIDLIGGGRLGTGVKKGFLVGGEVLGEQRREDGEVRTFCIEWGGM